MPTINQPSWQALASNPAEEATETSYVKVPDLAAKPDFLGALYAISDRTEFERFMKPLMVAAGNKFKLSLSDSNDLLTWHPEGTIFALPEIWEVDDDGCMTDAWVVSFVAPCDVQALEALLILICLSLMGEGQEYCYAENVSSCDDEPHTVFFDCDT